MRKPKNSNYVFGYVFGVDESEAVLVQAYVADALLVVDTFADKVAVQLAVTTAIADALITTAKGLVPATESVVEGTDTNLITLLDAITDMSATGVTLTLDASSNAQVANDGVITYGGSEVVGDIIVKINKTNGTEQTVAVTVPATGL